MPRPCRLTPDVSARVCAGLRAGLSRSLAARAAGVSARSVFNWLRKGQGRAARPEFRQFCRDVWAAEREVSRRCLETIAAAALAGDWRAAAVLLDRQAVAPGNPFSRPTPRDLKQIIDRIDPPVRPPQREKA